MKLQEVKAIAKAKGIKTVNMIKPELIRSIQKLENNFDCYGSATSGFCDQVSCLWRKDCLEFYESY